MIITIVQVDGIRPVVHLVGNIDPTYDGTDGIFTLVDYNPSVTVSSSDTGSDTITVTIQGVSDNSDIESYEFQISEDGETWETVAIQETSSTSYNYTYSGLVQETTYYVRVIVTNEVGYSATSEAVEVTTAAVPGEYDDEGNQTIKFTYSTTDWTNGSVYVYVTTTTSYSIQYNITDPDDESYWIDYTEGVEFTENGSIWARLIDDAGNTGEYATGSVGNIDTTSPTVSLTVTDYDDDSITVKATASDSESGIASYAFYIGTSDDFDSMTLKATKTSSYSSYSYTFSGLNSETTFYIVVAVSDLAGNESKVSSTQTTESGSCAPSIIWDTEPTSGKTEYDDDDTYYGVVKGYTQLVEVDLESTHTYDVSIKKKRLHIHT